MKTLQIEETATQYVIKPLGSNTARIVSKNDGPALAEAFAEILAEAPEEKPAEPEPEPEPEAAEADDIVGVAGGLLEGLGQLLKTPEAQRAKSLLEQLPKPKKKHG